ncbi:hypothetical protein TNCV_3977561 [Trichonephila clavipes]|nr:hypothetical protein TNCV_3977561 [Trichonephila clavipes]
MLPAIYTEGKKGINTPHNIPRLIQLHPLEQNMLEFLRRLRILTTAVFQYMAWSTCLEILKSTQVATPSLNTASTPRNIPCVIL